MDERTLHEHAYPLARRLAVMAERWRREGAPARVDELYAEAVRALRAFALAAPAPRRPAPADAWAAGE